MTGFSRFLRFGFFSLTLCPVRFLFMGRRPMTPAGWRSCRRWS